jgi:hypothetical protein
LSKFEKDGFVEEVEEEHRVDFGKSHFPETSLRQ